MAFTSSACTAADPRDRLDVCGRPVFTWRPRRLRSVAHRRSSGAWPPCSSPTSRASATSNATFGRSNLIPLQPLRADPDRLRVLVVTESFLPQVNGVTNSVAACSSTSPPRATSPSSSLRPARRPTPASRSRIARGASLPFYRDFRIGLETRRRLRAVMLRFQPDVVHIASPATLGYQAAQAARELGIPTVAIYQTDLVGFAERYGIAGGMAAMYRPDPPDPPRVDRTLAPSTRRLAQLEEHAASRRSRAGRAASTSRCSTPSCRDEALHARAGPGRAAARRVRRPARSGEGARAARPRRPAPRRAARRRRRRSRRGSGCGRCCPTRPSSACCTATSSAAPTPRSTSSCTPGATRPTARPPRRRSRQRRPGRRAPRRRADRRRGRRRRPASSTEPGDGGELASYVAQARRGRRPARPRRTARPRAAACRAAPGRRSTSGCVEHYRDVIGIRTAARRAG